METIKKLLSDLIGKNEDPIKTINEEIELLIEDLEIMGL